MRALCFCLVALAYLPVCELRAQPNHVGKGHAYVFLAEKRPVLIRMEFQLDGAALDKTWRKAIGQVFAYLDRDENGDLSQKEAARTPPATLLFGGGGFFSNAAPPTFARLDTDSNGKVSQSELAGFYRKNGGGPIHFQRSGGGSNRYIFVEGMGGNRKNNNDAATINKRILTLLDTNKDGKITRAELVAGPAAFLKMDLNDDEMVALEELLGEPAVNTGSNGVLAVAFDRRIQAQPSSAGLLVPVDSASLGQRLLSRYGEKSGRELTRGQLGVGSREFQRLDKNADGKLNVGELNGFSELANDLQLSVQLEGKGQGNAFFKSIATKKSRNPADVKLNKSAGKTVSFEIGNERIYLGASVSRSPYLVRFDQKQFYLTQFNTADRDNNKYVDRTESTRQPFFRNSFQLMDADGDGKIFEKELLGYANSISKLQANTRNCCVSLNFSARGKGLFDVLDTRSDIGLSVRELRGMVKLLDQLDRNRDGRIGSDEIPQHFQLNVSRGAGGGGGLGGTFVVVRGGIRPSPRQQLPAGKGPAWFQKMDLNNDGDVSRREFLGSVELFRRIDSDGDGLLSYAEAQKADREFQKN